ncbi:hypothetical protein Ciccas_012044 [Cichlidogyrus casuarinus]|uniref:Uncharacterized protein n=1 Tax=Cichlidogyrus casuarinus TaxID=1844966 RepID=A0ABD2PR96_9PLAT
MRVNLVQQEVVGEIRLLLRAHSASTNKRESWPASQRASELKQQQDGKERAIYVLVTQRQFLCEAPLMGGGKVKETGCVECKQEINAIM